MTQEYVIKTNRNAYRVAGSRVSLESIVYEFLDGASPEGIADDFPTLTLEQVYGAITYYLAHRSEIDSYLKAEQVEFEAQREEARKRNPRLYKQLEDAMRALKVRP